MTFDLGKIDFISSIRDGETSVVRILIDRQYDDMLKKLYHTNLNKIRNIKCVYRTNKIILNEVFVERISTLNRTDNKIKLSIIVEEIKIIKV